MKEIKLFNLKLNTYSFPETIERIGEFVKSARCAQVVTLSTEMLIGSEKDKTFEKTINQAELVTADSAGIIWAAKKLKKIKIEKVSGVDLVLELCRLSGGKKWNIFILGSTERSISEAVRRLKEKYADINIAGYHNGYFKEDQKVIDCINGKNVDILFVALGSPKQESWIYNNKEKLNVKTAIGVGGSFDVISGQHKRAPQWMISASLEWLYRLITQPGRFMRMLAIPKLILNVGLAKLGKVDK